MKKIVIVLLFCLVFLTGCSYVELNDMVIVSTLGVDYDNGLYTVSAQVIDYSTATKEGENIVDSSILYVGYGNSIISAVRDMYNAYPKNLHMGHLELLVVGNGVLKEHFKDIFDYLIRSPEATNDPLVVLNTNGSALEILNLEGKKGKSYNGKAIVDNIEENQKHEGSVSKKNLEEVLSLILQKGIDPVIPTVEYKENVDKFSNTLLTGFAVFTDNVIKNLDEKASVAYNIVNANFIDIPIITKYNDKDVTILFLRPSSEVNLSIEDSITVNIDITGIGHISEIYEQVDLIDDKVIKELNDSYEATIKDYINCLIEFCRVNNADILGLKNKIYKFNNKFYEKYKDKNIYEVANFKINVDMDLFRHGTTYKGTIGENDAKD